MTLLQKIILFNILILCFYLFLKFVPIYVNSNPLNILLLPILGLVYIIGIYSFSNLLPKNIKTKNFVDFFQKNKERFFLSILPFLALSFGWFSLIMVLWHDKYFIPQKDYSKYSSELKRDQVFGSYSERGIHQFFGNFWDGLEVINILTNSLFSIFLNFYLLRAALQNSKN